MKSQILIPLLAGLVLLGACKGKSSGEAADSASEPLSKVKSMSSKTDTISNGPKLIKTADMKFKVKSVQQTTEQVTALTASFNGMVIHHLMNSTADKSVDIQKSNDSLMRLTVVNTTAEMTIKVPPANMESFMNQVSRLGIYINNRRMDVSDKSLDYLSTRLKLKNQDELVKDQKGETNNKKDPTNILAFKNNMVDQQIGNRKIDDSVKNSIVILSFYESNVISRELIANDDLSAYNLSFFKRLGMALENGWDMFVYVIVAFANFWVLIPIGFGIWMGIKYYKNKKAVAVAK